MPGLYTDVVLVDKDYGNAAAIRNGMELSVGTTDHLSTYHATRGAIVDTQTLGTDQNYPVVVIGDSRVFGVSQSLTQNVGDQIAGMRVLAGITLASSAVSGQWAAFVAEGAIGSTTSGQFAARGRYAVLASHLDLLAPSTDPADGSATLLGTDFHLGFIGSGTGGTVIGHNISAMNAIGTWDRAIGYRFEGVNLSATNTWVLASDPDHQSSHGGPFLAGSGGPRMKATNDSVALTAGGVTSAPTGNTTNGSSSITSISPVLSDDDVGKRITGTGIPAGSYIYSVTAGGATVEIRDGAYDPNTNHATATATGVALTVGTNRTTRLRPMTAAQIGTLTALDGMLAYQSDGTTGFYGRDGGTFYRLAEIGGTNDWANAGSVRNLPTLSLGTTDDLSTVATRLRVRDASSYAGATAPAMAYYDWSPTLNPSSQVNPAGLSVSGTTTVTATGTNVDQLNVLSAATVLIGTGGKINTAARAGSFALNVGALTGAAVPTAVGITGQAGLQPFSTGSGITTAIGGEFGIFNAASSGSIGTSIGVRINAATNVLGQSLGTQIGLQALGTSGSSRIVHPVMIGANSAPATAAILDLSGQTTKGFLPPVVTSTQRDAITSPVAGLSVWNSTNTQHEYYDGSTWRPFGYDQVDIESRSRGTTGSLDSTYDRATVAEGNIAALTSGTLLLVRVFLPAGLTVTNISFWSATTALATGTHQWFALYSSALAKLAVTSDDTSTAWAANTKKTLALSSAYTTTSAGWYYLGCMVAATTVPTLVGIATLGTANIRAAAPIPTGNSSTGQTTPAAAPTTAAAITASTNMIYAEVS